MHVPVLVVGGGPIGLTASVLLSHLGIASLLVNRRPTTSTHPRARFVDVRTIEILRQLGLADAVIDTGVPPEWVQSVRYSETFARPEVYRLPTESYHSVPRTYSPTVPVMTAQDLVEPIMLEAARSQSTADIRFSTELVSLEHDEVGCRATIRDLETGAEQKVTADYVIGADGRMSTVRTLLGGDLLEGYTNPMQIQDVLYHADMSRWVGDRIGALLFVNHPMGYGLFQPMDGKTRWRAQCTTFTPPIPPDEVTEDDCIAWIRSAIGDTEGELELEVQSIAPWNVDARLSDAFRRGRVFLAGDAAHMLSPTGGYGMNLGYHGIHNLAWKLAFVLNGHALPEILDTYEVERRPQADRTRIASVDNAMLAAELYATHFRGDDLADVTHRLRQYGNFEGMILGGEYSSALCVAESEPGPAVDNELTDFVPCVRAGRRAPHVWIDAARSRSVLDLFGSTYVLLTASGGASALVQQALGMAESGFPIQLVELSEDILAPDLYADDTDVLVRPDGVVAARVPHQDRLDLEAWLTGSA
ncbi:MAG: FAD-dependent monooxygenase [Acidimicrobiales bacterium]